MLNKSEVFDPRTFKRTGERSPERLASKMVTQIESSLSSDSEALEDPRKAKTTRNINSTVRLLASPTYVHMPKPNIGKKRNSIMFVKGLSKTTIPEDGNRSSDGEIQVDSDSNDDQPATKHYNSKVLMSQISVDINKSEKVDDETKDPNKFIFKRHSIFIQVWNMVIFACFLIDIVVIPSELCTLESTYVGILSFLLLNFVQLIYLADIFVNFNKTYYTDNVLEVTNKVDIALRYFSSPDFFSDLICCAPVLAFFQVYFKPKVYNQLFLLVRMTKGFRIKEIVVEFHQRFYVSSKLYFLGYLVSVLIIVGSFH